MLSLRVGIRFLNWKFLSLQSQTSTGLANQQGFSEKVNFWERGENHNLSERITWMKLIPIFIALLSAVSITAQDMKLLDEVVYENKTPVAYFSKLLYSNNNPNNISGLLVYNNTKKLLFTVIPKKVVVQLSKIDPFYYYDINFLQANDSISIYPQEALSLHIFNLIKDYRLIKNGDIDSAALANLQTNYDRSAFNAKMLPVWQFMYEPKNFERQVKRNRDKPVYLINESIIMQDSVKIGYFAKRIRANIDDRPTPAVTIAREETFLVIKPAPALHTVDSWENSEIRMADDTPVDNLPMLMNLKPATKLYEISLPLKKKPSPKYKQRLELACLLIENYSL
jgi:hypothetical protein